MANWSQILLIVRWLLAKGDVLPQLMQVVERFKAADTMSEYFGAGEELCRILSVESTDFPDLNLMMSDDDCGEMEIDLKGEATQKGFNFAALIAIATLIYEFWKSRQELQAQT
jgi:hypothetical protein